jgi:TusA-related sulfurtransferase
LSNGQRVTLARRVDCRGDSCPRPQLMTMKEPGTWPPVC